MPTLRLAALCAVLACAPAWAGGDAAIKAALAAQQGKRVTVQLQSGTEMTGVVQSVADDALKLGELSGKEYFDAVVRLDRIDAVTVRVKNP
ncbi:MAG TPA: hypothetical protein VM074_06410 [Solimonas sp.]|nr:hypothetical protein [Solimonas sp.]